MSKSRYSYSTMVTDVTRCPICLELFDQPKSLPCLHTFCLKCIQSQCRDKEHGDVEKCPVCRTAFTIPAGGLENLVHNFFIQTFVDARKIASEAEAAPCAACRADFEESSVEDGETESVPPATKYCVNCDQKLCTRCSRPHRRMGCEPHVVIDIGEDFEMDYRNWRARVCERHKNSLVSLYCVECRSNICLTCMTEQHQQHRSKPVDAAAEEFLQEMEPYLKDIASHEDIVQQDLARLEDSKNQCQRHRKRVEELIRQKADDVKQLVDEDVNELISEARALETEIFKQIDAQMDTLDQKLAPLESFKAYASELRSKGKACDITRAVSTLHLRATELLQSEVARTVYIPRTVEFIARNIEELQTGCGHLIGIVAAKNETGSDDENMTSLTTSVMETSADHGAQDQHSVRRQAVCNPFLSDSQLRRRYVSLERHHSEDSQLEKIMQQRELVKNLELEQKVPFNGDREKAAAELKKLKYETLKEAEDIIQLLMEQCLHRNELAENLHTREMALTEELDIYRMKEIDLIGKLEEKNEEFEKLKMQLEMLKQNKLEDTAKEKQEADKWDSMISELEALREKLACESNKCRLMQIDHEKRELDSREKLSELQVQLEIWRKCETELNERLTHAMGISENLHSERERDDQERKQLMDANVMLRLELASWKETAESKRIENDKLLYEKTGEVAKLQIELEHNEECLAVLDEKLRQEMEKTKKLEGENQSETVTILQKKLERMERERKDECEDFGRRYRDLLAQLNLKEHELRKLKEELAACESEKLVNADLQLKIQRQYDMLVVMGEELRQGVDKRRVQELELSELQTKAELIEKLKSEEAKKAEVNRIEIRQLEAVNAELRDQVEALKHVEAELTEQLKRTTMERDQLQAVGTELKTKRTKEPEMETARNLEGQQDGTWKNSGDWNDKLRLTEELTRQFRISMQAKEQSWPGDATAVTTTSSIADLLTTDRVNKFKRQTGTSTDRITVSPQTTASNYCPERHERHTSVLHDCGSAIVIDNGSGVCKAGFAGNDEPAVVFPSVVGTKKYQQSTCLPSTDVNETNFVGEVAQRCRGRLRLNYPIQLGRVGNWNDMEKIWQHVFKELRANPREHPVLLTEPVLNYTESREKTMQIMFEKFGVPGCYVANQAVLSLHSVGQRNGIVVDCGDGLMQCVPIDEGSVLKYAARRTNLAGRVLTNNLTEILKERNYRLTTSAEYEIVRDIKEKLCYVALDFEQEMQKAVESPTLVGVYELPDGKVVVVGDQRFRCPEPLFKPSMVGNEEDGIHEILFKSIAKCETPQLREFMYSNIYLTGGTTLLPGFERRLEKEFRGLVPRAAKVKITALPERNYSVWIGGSRLASEPDFIDKWITKKEYEEIGSRILQTKCP